MCLAAQSVGSALLLLCLCVPCLDLSSVSLPPANGQSQDSGSSCPLPRVKPHTWSGRFPPRLPRYAHSPDVQQVPVGLGKFKVVSLWGSLGTWTSAQWRVCTTPSGGWWGTPSAHLCHSLPLLPCSFLPRMPAVPVKIPYVFFRALLPCQPLAPKPHGPSSTSTSQ